MFNMRRRLGLAALIALLLLTGAAPAAAAATGQAFIGSPNGSIGSFGNIVADRGAGVNLSFGVKGLAVATVADATLQAPDYPGISVGTSMGECTGGTRSV